MFYYALNVIWPTMIAVLFTDVTTDFRYGIVLTLPQNLGKHTPSFLCPSHRPITNSYT